ncbi:ATP-binding protein [candidate division KSB1 bacterium]|nr:ATP-binding protein [candidate division KSB1 bacterium]
MKKLPISISNFETLITGNNVYVDKTRYIHHMVSEGMFYFLSRPRRFGKSLLVSTLKALFEGRKELFKGLWIESADWDWKPHPVAVIDFNGISHGTPETLKQGLWLALKEIAQQYQINLSSQLLPESFKEVIIGLSRYSGARVVILVDEYDKPLISHLGKGKAALEIAKQNREVLREFYGVLKEGNVNEALKFVFITGISKFTRVSIFSELNNLNDLTMHPAYAALVGYTQEELETSFKDFIQTLSKNKNESYQAVLDKLKLWYNGYRFTDEDSLVYNPYSILHVLQRETFENYWFETGTPAFLVDLIKEKKYPIPDIENLQLQGMSFSTYDLDHLELEPLLFQSGYVTIHGFDGVRYRLGYPNQEVKTSFLSFLYKSLVDIPSTTLKEQYTRLHEFLAQEEIEPFIETANAILSAIPYPHVRKQGESYYHTIFYLMLSASGVLVHTEVLNIRGRVDMEVHFQDKVYIVELKCNQSAKKAIAQIKAKKYFEKYLQSGKKILLLGINFNTQERRIEDWRVEVVQT